MTDFGKVLVANRAEIALRIVRGVRTSGRETVAIHSDVDADAPHVRAADQSVHLPGTSPAETYLDIERLLDAATASGADAVHPGYGFLSENAHFARAVIERGLVWIGPSPDVIALMGDKASARRAAAAAGVRGIPGDSSAVVDPEKVVAFGEEYGWPVAIKAAFGGGGRGMRVVPGPDEAAAHLESAISEATRAFGNGDCYLERYLPAARHVEVQVLADDHGTTLAVGDRDCSVQRRNQKLVEESPAPGISDAVRAEMAAAAVRLAEACDYRNAGTVEFLYADGEFWFLEMNTRLQVEHPVTELVTGVDLVAEQLRVASGRPLSIGRDDVVGRGHAIECRINAERYRKGSFLPAPGRITRLSIPGGPFVRFDVGYDDGAAVTPHYDNLIGKVVTWGRDREEARRRMVVALDELVVEGVHTTAAVHRVVLRHPDFVAGEVSTQWFEHSLDLSQLEAAAPVSPPP